MFAPAGVGAGSAVPLLCMLHGCTQDPASFAAATRIAAAAEQHGFVAVLPAQDRAANPMRCWNWFEPEQQRRDRGEPAAIAGIIASSARATRGSTLAGCSCAGCPRAARWRRSWP